MYEIILWRRSMVPERLRWEGGPQHQIGYEGVCSTKEVEED
jgi:hypothetical protein